MHEKDVLKRAFTMPRNNPAYLKGRYKFYNREFMVNHLPRRHCQAARSRVTGGYGAAER